MYKVAVFLKCQFVIQRHGYEILNTKDYQKSPMSSILYYKYSSFLLPEFHAKKNCDQQ